MPLRILSLSRSHASPAPQTAPEAVPTAQPTNVPQSTQQADGTELPAYSSQLPSNGELPTQNASTEQLRTHRFDLPTSTKPRPWLWMILKSEAPNIKSLPVFVEKPIAGSVEIDLLVGKPSTVVGVSVTVRGQIIASAIDSRPFWEVTQTLWDSSMPPPVPIDTPPAQGIAAQNRGAGRLPVGRYSLPFSFTVPQEVTLSEKVASQLHLSTRERLPPTLTGRGYHACTTYMLVVDVKRVGVLKSDRSLSTAIGYIPLSHPPRPSQLREIAYLNNVIPPGPMQDPNGWVVLPYVEMHGTAFKQRKVTVRCTLALAKPLEYTRGSNVSLFLVLRSADEQVLDILAQPNVPVVQMRKKIKTLMGIDAVGGAAPLAQHDADAVLSRAYWWRPGDGESQVDGGEENDGLDGDGAGKFRRCMMGEMTLPVSLTPSFNFGKFDLRYVVDMYPFRVAGFEPMNENNRLSRTEIVVHSGFAQQSPRPRAYLPPGYVSMNVDGAVIHREFGQSASSAGFM